MSQPAMRPDPSDAHPLDRPEQRGAGLVLIVDDMPGNLAVLHDALDEAGYTVLVATDGPTALGRAMQARPDIVLLDAVMPGMDGFEVARRLKAQPHTAPIPIVFMTGFTETERVVEAYAAGGVDYVTKPIQPREVLARIAAHTQSARAQQQARHALDAFGHATMVVRASDGRLVWQTALARELLLAHFGTEGPFVPAPVVDWVRQEAAACLRREQPQPLVVGRGGRRLTLTLHPMADAELPAEARVGRLAEADEDAGEWLLVASQRDDAALLEALLRSWRLTAREAEVLLWVARGKTNRDIGDILGSSARTVTKHMEHILPKLGVETRTAAAAQVIARLGQIS